ncbi:MAG: DsrH/TusB family sulfur metabolism protein [Nitrososphaerales archaeon]|jgi:sulfur relay protein TusB/DsrH
MTIYLVDEPFVETAVSYASLDDNAHVVLLQDAVYSATGIMELDRIYVIEDDVVRRGLGLKIPSRVNVITYDKLVQMMKKEKVINFL